jgi:two-component system response regulator FixJ
MACDVVPERGRWQGQDARRVVVTAAAPVVVVVDDDDSLRDAMARLLTAAGFESDSYDSAESLLAVGLRPDAACVVSDLKLPGMTGLELLASLEAQGSSVPVVLITAHDSAGMADVVRRQGAAAYMAKPFRGTALLGVIRSLLADRHT